MQSDLFYCKVTVHVSGITATIIRNTKNCNRSFRYWSHILCIYLPPTWPLATLEVMEVMELLVQ